MIYAHGISQKVAGLIAAHGRLIIAGRGPIQIRGQIHGLQLDIDSKIFL